VRAAESKRESAQRFLAWSRDSKRRPTGGLKANPIDGAIHSRRRHVAGRRAMKDVIKVIVGLIIIVVAFKLIAGLLGLLIGVALAGLVVYGGMKLLEGPRNG
jgi:hypothetical protein